MLEIGQKVNGKYIENPFLAEEYIDFINEIVTPGTDMNQLYEHNKKLRAVEIANDILKLYEEQTPLSEDFMKLLAKPKSIKLALVTEPWSIETAHILYYIKQIEKNGQGKVQVLIFLRDTNPEIVEKVLEDPTVNLPRIIIMDRKNEVKRFWGPRTEEAELYYQTLLEKGADKMERYAEMQKWYKEDNGKAFQKEFFEVIKEVFNGF